MQFGSQLSTDFGAPNRGRPVDDIGQLPLQLNAAPPSDQTEPLPDLSLAGLFLLPIAIFIITLLTIKFSQYSNIIATIWPASAVVLVALLRHKRSVRNYAPIFAGSGCAIVLASLAAGNGWAASAVIGAADIFEIAVTVAFLSVCKIDASNLTGFKNLLLFILIGACIAPIGCDAITAMAIGAARGGIPWRTVWLHTYPAHALGMVCVAPFLISVTSKDWQRLRIQHRYIEATIIFLIVVGAAVCGSYFRSVIFIIVPAILLATVRFGLIGATAANLVTSFIASSFVVLGIGQTILERPPLADQITALQVLLAFTSLWCLPIAALLVERDRLLEFLSAANTGLRLETDRQSDLLVGLRRHLAMVEENERLRLSHELHDQAGQGLIAAILQLNEIDPSVDDPTRERLHLVRKKMEDLGKTLHRIAWELRPPAIDELGLKKALASYIADWSEQCGTEADFQCDDPDIDDVPGEIGTAVYRVVQEGLTNIVKHARQPSNVSVVIGRVHTALQVIIEDNGCGFDVGTINTKDGSFRGLGLDGMRERLMLIGGTLEIESTPGAGTALFARIALDASDDAPRVAQ
jgi:signal transduction histidine kinase